MGAAILEEVRFPLQPHGLCGVVRQVTATRAGSAVTAA